MFDTSIFSSSRLTQEILPAWLPQRRWFGGKARTLQACTVVAANPVVVPERQFLAVRVEYADGAPELYAVPLGIAASGEVEEAAVLWRENGRVLHDAVAHPQFRADLLDLMRTNSASGALAGNGSGFLSGMWAQDGFTSRVLAVEQSNTSIIYGERLFLKLFRRLQPGVNPDAEITRFLSERQGFTHVPPYAGELQFTLAGLAHPAGLMLGCVENHGDAWAWSQRALADYYASGGKDFSMMPRVRQLAVRTAEMHRALAAGSDDPAFHPEPLTVADFVELGESIGARFAALLRQVETRPEFTTFWRERLPGAAGAAQAKIAALTKLPPGGLKIRHHGDYHLGQVLESGGDWKIIDFEGEPSRPLHERRAKRSPLRDVAGMLRSFAYAAHAARPDDRGETLARAGDWAAEARKVFWEAYLEVSRAADFLPKSHRVLLNAYVLEKALYEIDYELNNRPAWLPIPLHGLLDAVTGLDG
jgi:trehalose synthase-fused probable maltokinase